MEPTPSRFAPTAAVAAADHLAAEAGAHVLRSGGSAADAAVATSAAMAVTSPHLCGMGGDLFALVHDGHGVHALAANGAAGSGASADALRAEGLTRVPARDHIAATPVPGCVDGWVALHERFGRLPLADVLAPAIALADGGFPASPTLALAVGRMVGRAWAADLAAATGRPGALVRRPGVARALRAVAADGRAGFYLGEAGDDLLAVGAGHFAAADLEARQDRWVEPLALDALGRTIWTVPAPSQGYLALAGAWVAEATALVRDGLAPDDPAWAHLLVEAARAVGHDREAVLHEGATSAQLLGRDRLEAAAARFDPARASALPDPLPADGDTTYLCAVDGERMGVSLIQSNAGGFGSGLGLPNVGIGLQNRGQGFSLEPGHPAEIGPGRRPPHTLAPLLVTDGQAGPLAAVLGTMGGDAQPQVLLQLLARIFGSGEPVTRSLAAPRWALRSADPADVGDGFSTWRGRGRVAVDVEGHAPSAWADGLAERGHDVTKAEAFGHGFGHAQAIVVRADGVLEAGADPRSRAGAAIGF